MTSTRTTRKKRTILVSLLTGTALVCVPAVGQSKPGSPLVQTKSVLVVNGAGQPVPTAAQGTTNVAGTVNIGNAPSVNVANTPSVNVANTPTVNLSAGGSVGVTNPLDGQNNPTPLAVLEATQPYQDQCTLNLSGNDVGSCSFSAIPSGKRLVIQEFDALGVFIQGVKPLELAVNLQGYTHYFPATFMGTNSESVDFFATHQETRLYGLSGAPICSVIVTSNSSGGYYLCQLSGFLVDVP